MEESNVVLNLNINRLLEKLLSILQTHENLYVTMKYHNGCQTSFNSNKICIKRSGNLTPEEEANVNKNSAQIFSLYRGKGLLNSFPGTFFLNFWQP